MHEMQTQFKSAVEAKGGDVLKIYQTGRGIVDAGSNSNGNK